MCAITDTLLADSDGVYHPALFNDRLILGLKGIMSEAETAHPARTTRRWHSQQGGAGRTAPRLAGRFGVGRERG